MDGLAQINDEYTAQNVEEHSDDFACEDFLEITDYSNVYRDNDSTDERKDWVDLELLVGLIEHFKAGAQKTTNGRKKVWDTICQEYHAQRPLTSFTVQKLKKAWENKKARAMRYLLRRIDAFQNSSDSAAPDFEYDDLSERVIKICRATNQIPSNINSDAADAVFGSEQPSINLENEFDRIPNLPVPANMSIPSSYNFTNPGDFPLDRNFWFFLIHQGHGRIGGHYFHTRCPYVRPSKTRYNANIGCLENKTLYNGHHVCR